MDIHASNLPADDDAVPTVQEAKPKSTSTSRPTYALKVQPAPPNLEDLEQFPLLP